MPIINGRRVNEEFMSGSAIIAHANPGPGRRTVIRRGFEAETVEAGKTYGPHDLKDKRDRPVQVETIPDRTKGGFR